MSILKFVKIIYDCWCLCDEAYLVLCRLSCSCCLSQLSHGNDCFVNGTIGHFIRFFATRTMIFLYMFTDFVPLLVMNFSAVKAAICIPVCALNIVQCASSLHGRCIVNFNYIVLRMADNYDGYHSNDHTVCKYYGKSVYNILLRLIYQWMANKLRINIWEWKWLNMTPRSCENDWVWMAVEWRIHTIHIKKYLLAQKHFTWKTLTHMQCALGFAWIYFMTSFYIISMLR